MRAAIDREACPRLKYYRVRQSWRHLMENLSDTQKSSIYETIISNIAEQDETVAKDLQAEYITTASNSRSRAAEKFFEDWRMVLVSYPDTGRLTACLQDQAEIRPHWARTFLGNALLVVESVVA